MKSNQNAAGQPAAKTKNRSSRSNGDSSKYIQPAHEQIASLATQLYIESGCVEGRDAENWLRAEQILRQKAAETTKQRA